VFKKQGPRPSPLRQVQEDEKALCKRPGDKPSSVHNASHANPLALDALMRARLSTGRLPKDAYVVAPDRPTARAGSLASGTLHQ